MKKSRQSRTSPLPDLAASLAQLSDRHGANCMIATGSCTTARDRPVFLIGQSAFPLVKLLPGSSPCTSLSANSSIMFARRAESVAVSAR
jgi:hypothetical protein